MRAQQIIAALAALLLVACAPPPAPTPGPTTAPTAAAATTRPTAAAPTTAPATTGLPAPLYLLEAGQIARIEPDATTRAVITAERPPFPGVEPIAEFAVGPSGTLAYVVSDVEVDRLMIADARAQGATVRYAEQGHELSDMVFTPDGQALVLRLLNNRQPPDLPSGLYRLPLAGGAPELLRADDPTDDPVNPSRSVSGYRPIAFSPDGSLILLQVYSLFYEDCGLGVIAAAGGEVTRLNLPEGESVYCGEEAWSDDSAAVFFLAGKPTGDDAGPRLWRADAATGAAAPATEESFARAPLGMPGGGVRFFMADLLRDAGGSATEVTFAPAELAAPGTAPTELAAPFDQRLSLALWAPDGSGAVVEISGESGRASLRWLPISGEPVDLPNADAPVEQMAWGSD